jgi:hypothetical protein
LGFGKNKKKRLRAFFVYTTLFTLPALRQRVQTATRLGVPSTSALTFWTLAFQVLFVLMFEWLT